MKTRDLMMGDYISVKPSGMPIKVSAVHHKKVAYHAIISKLIWVRESLLEPIPLIPEILEKNGFIANKHVYPYPYYEYTNEENKLKVGFAFPHGNRTSYKDPWVYIDSEDVFVEHLPCVFVHQLQHAFRLCGIEKEIVI